MKKKQLEKDCVSCGKTDLSKNEVGIDKKLLGEDIDKYYCLECLAEYLGVSVDEILAKIEDFRADGCKLFD